MLIEDIEHLAAIDITIYLVDDISRLRMRCSYVEPFKLAYRKTVKFKTCLTFKLKVDDIDNFPKILPPKFFY